MIAERRCREAELSPAVSEWLRAMGYSVYAEVDCSLEGPVDHVGVRWSDESIVCVELKTALTKKLLRQCLLAQLVTPLVYAAVPRRPRLSSIEQAKRWGIGVWADGAVILEPTDVRESRRRGRYRERTLEVCRNLPEGGIGGLPTLKGEGPAIRCAAAVRKYFAANSTATWNDAWRDVPNHYAHARSMQGALSLRTQGKDS